MSNRCCSYDILVPNILYTLMCQLEALGEKKRNKKQQNNGGNDCGYV